MADLFSTVRGSGRPPRNYDRGLSDGRPLPRTVLNKWLGNFSACCVKDRNLSGPFRSLIEEFDGTIIATEVFRASDAEFEAHLIGGNDEYSQWNSKACDSRDGDCVGFSVPDYFSSGSYG